MGERTRSWLEVLLAPSFAVGLLLLLLPVSACDLLPQLRKPAAPPLEHTSWLLVAYGPVGGEMTEVSARPVLRDGPYELSFYGEGEPNAPRTGFEGSTGCNGFAGAYSASGDGSLSTSEIIISLTSCPEATSEEMFVTGVRAAVAYRRRGDELRIYYPKDRSRVLHFVLQE